MKNCRRNRQRFRRCGTDHRERPSFMALFHRFTVHCKGWSEIWSVVTGFETFTVFYGPFFLTWEEVSVKSIGSSNLHPMILFSLKMTNPNDPTDWLAIEVGKLFTNVNDRKKSSLLTEIERIQVLEREKAVEGTNEFDNPIHLSSTHFVSELKQLEKEREHCDEALKNMAEKRKLIEKQIEEKREQVKRKYHCWVKCFGVRLFAKPLFSSDLFNGNVISPFGRRINLSFSCGLNH